MPLMGTITATSGGAERMTFTKPGEQGEAHRKQKLDKAPALPANNQ